MEMRMDERQRTILQDVAEGRLSPEDAAQLLDEVEEAGGDEHPDGPSGQRSSTGIQRVRLVQAFRATRVVGDPDVAEAVVEGPHVAEREGDILVVHGDEAPAAHGFAFSRGDRPWYPSRPERGERSDRGDRGSGEDLHWWPGSWGSPPGWAGHWGLVDVFRRRLGEELTVRMRPDLTLDAGVTAGSLKVAGLTGPLRISVAGGSASLDRFQGPLDLSVDAGSAKGSGLLASGSSRIRCHAGSVKINLERGSSVRIRARTELGKVLLPGDPNWLAGGDVTVGDGEALLEVEVNIGSVVVSTDR
jgi:hypothetical protein